MNHRIPRPSLELKKVRMRFKEKADGIKPDQNLSIFGYSLGLENCLKCFEWVDRINRHNASNHMKFYEGAKDTKLDFDDKRTISFTHRENCIWKDDPAHLHRVPIDCQEENG